MFRGCAYVLSIRGLHGTGLEIKLSKRAGLRGLQAGLGQGESEMIPQICI